MSKRLIWQGSHDSLCGIYCAAHIIACQKTAHANSHDLYEDFVKAAFLRLMKSAENLDLLTARRIAGGQDGGYYSPQIVRIFNDLGLRSRAGLEAVAFASAQFKRYALATPARERFEGPTFAIVKEDGGKHWLAVDGLHRNGGYHCYDPNREDNLTHRERIHWDDGVMIAPQGWLAR